MSESGTGSAALPETKPSAHYLYFLVCADHTGPQAGLFKLGISKRLAHRHHEHTRTWQKFDLSRSALLRASSREEVQSLETALRHIFGDAGAAGRSRAVGATHRPDGSPAPPTWRRDPGRKADGYTKFYDIRCLNLMLSLVEGWLACREQRAAGACLLRGLDPSDIALSAGCKGGSPPSPRRRAAQGPPILWDQEVMEAHIAAKVSQVLDLALAHESYLRFVALLPWQRARDTKTWVRRGSESLFRLYFGGFGPVPAPAGSEGHAKPRSAAQVAFWERVAAICAAPGDDELLRRCRWEWRQPVVSVWEPPSSSDDPSSPFRIPDTLVVEVTPRLYRPAMPFLKRFEALDERVTARRRR